MVRPAHTILIADPDPRARAMLARQLDALECRILESDDGPAALTAIATEDVRLLISELYLPTGEDRCLLVAVRRRLVAQELRIIAHSHRSLGDDRDWAVMAGADAYLIKPTRAQRIRYVVGRLLAMRPDAPLEIDPSEAPPRRESLEDALRDIERGTLAERSCIVFGREWWQSLSSAERMSYRRRAKSLHVSLRSDSDIGEHYVEVRGRYRPDLGPATEQPESPYRR